MGCALINYDWRLIWSQLLNHQEGKAELVWRQHKALVVTLRKCCKCQHFFVSSAKNEPEGQGLI